MRRRRSIATADDRASRDGPSLRPVVEESSSSGARARYASHCTRTAAAPEQQVWPQRSHVLSGTTPRWPRLQTR